MWGQVDRLNVWLVKDQDMELPDFVAWRLLCRECDKDLVFREQLIIGVEFL